MFEASLVYRATFQDNLGHTEKPVKKKKRERKLLVGIKQSV